MSSLRFFKQIKLRIKMKESIQLACRELFESSDEITCLTDGEKKQFLTSINKILFNAYEKRDEIMDSIIAELEK